MKVPTQSPSFTQSATGGGGRSVRMEGGISSRPLLPWLPADRLQGTEVTCRRNCAVNGSGQSRVLGPCEGRACRHIQSDDSYLFKKFFFGAGNKKEKASRRTCRWRAAADGRLYRGIAAARLALSRRLARLLVRHSIYQPRWFGRCVFPILVGCWGEGGGGVS